MRDTTPWAALEGTARVGAIDRSFVEGVITEAEWYRAIRDLLEAAHLAAVTPYGQSGAGGGSARCERKRRVIAEAIDRDGDFLDVGCANGLLMESMAAWAAARGYRIEPYGLDISPSLVALARQRLPHWSDRLMVGNVMTWEPPRRFDFVRTELVYVPEPRRPELVERLLRRAVAPRGRLIVCGYGEGGIAGRLRDWRYDVRGEASVYRDDGSIWTQVAWVEAPA